MKIFLAILVGIIAGMFVMAIGVLQLCAGILRIDSSDEDGPYLFLDLDKNVDSIRERKYVLFKVKEHNFITRD